MCLHNFERVERTGAGPGFLDWLPEECRAKPQGELQSQRWPLLLALTTATYSGERAGRSCDLDNRNPD